MKKMLSITLLACSLLSVLPVSEAAIPIHAIANTASIMRNGLRASFSDAIIALRLGLITSLRTINPDIIYDPPEPGKHRCHAGNQWLEPVAKLLINLFPSPGGILSISLGHDHNLSTFMSEKTSKRTQYEIIAQLLIACREIRAGREYDAKHAINELQKTGAHRNGNNNKEFRNYTAAVLLPLFTIVAESVEFEKSTFLYSDNTTELLLLAWCCEFFNGKDDVVALLQVFKERDLIGEFDEALLGADNLPNCIDQIHTRIEMGENITSDELLIISPTNKIAPYALGENFDQFRKIKTKQGNTRDCVETTIRHLITIMCEYESETGTITAPGTFATSANSFFSTYSRGETANSGTREIHNDWYNEVILKNSDDSDSDEEGMKSSWYTITKYTNNITGSDIILEQPATGTDYTNKQAAQKLGQIAASGKIRNDVTFSFEADEANESEINCTVTKKDKPTEAFKFAISVTRDHSCLKSAYTREYGHCELVKRETDIDKFIADRGLGETGDVEPSISSKLAYKDKYHITNEAFAPELLQEQVIEVEKQANPDPRLIAGIAFIVDSILTNGNQTISSNSTEPAFSEGLEKIQMQHPELADKIQKILK